MSMKKLLSVLLAVAMLLSLAISALADETEENAAVAANQEDQEADNTATDEEGAAETTDQEDPDNDTVTDGENIADQEASDVESPTTDGEDAAEEDTVVESHWYDAAVQTVMDKGIMTGTDNGFAPEANVTRGTVVQVLYNMEGQPEILNKMSTFPDAQGKWYEDAVRWAQQSGITTGNGSGSFNGDASVTRAELAVFLFHYASSKEIFMTCDANLLDYVDGELVAGWAIPALQWAVSYQVINGTTDGWLNPKKTATRAELAQVLTNFITVIQPEDTSKGTVPGKDPAPLPMADHAAHTPQ